MAATPLAQRRHCMPGANPVRGLPPGRTGSARGVRQEIWSGISEDRGQGCNMDAKRGEISAAIFLGGGVHRDYFRGDLVAVISLLLLY